MMFRVVGGALLKSDEVPATRFRFARRRGVLAALAAAVVALSCASTPVAPRTFAFVAIAPGGARPSGVILSYPQALGAILWAMQNRLGFPALSGALELYPSHSSMALGLEGEGYEASYAVHIADQLDGVTRPGHIFADDATLRWQRWPARIAFLAHEMTHVAEYALAGGRRGSSAQWLREGLAEWVSWQVVDEYDLGSYPTRERTALLRLCDARNERRLPPFDNVASQRAWVRNEKHLTLDPSYDQSLLAVAFLIDLHGLPAVLEYFRLAARSDDARANFRAAFGETLQGFEETFQAHLNNLLR
jgi:hypothetical protein